MIIVARVKLIIPAYNARKYIEGSVRSALKQTYRDIEIVVVDDGSTDDTPRILDLLRQEDSRLNYFTVPNGGPAVARNRALDILGDQCEFVMFMDADDIILPDTVEYAVNGIKDADMGIFGFSIMNVDGSHRDYQEPEESLDNGSMGKALARLYKANLLNQVWGKIFRADIIRQYAMRFQDYRWGEDRLFIYDFLENSSSVNIMPECKYLYIMHAGESLITKFYDKKLQVCIQSDKRMTELCTKYGITDQRDFRYMFSKSIFSCITTVYSPSCKLDRRAKREYVREIITNNYVNQRCRDSFGGFAVRFLGAVVRTGCVWLNMLTFALVVFAETTLPGVVVRVKHKK